MVKELLQRIRSGGIRGKIRAIEEQIAQINATYYRVELWDNGEEKILTPSDAILAYAPYIRRVQIGEHAAPGTQLLLLTAKSLGHPNYRAIEFYDHTGANISREMQQAFIDRGLDQL